MDFKQMIGEQVRRVRKLRGITQEQLAEQSGLSFSYISDVEKLVIFRWNRRGRLSKLWV
ncbi:helix-turn-helix domain-containing protein [Paenibacillus cisolokensis]|uniref:helix-turn-helix domain-containing protein n=1 Tax=Paenibacillus cisolokensis TaxID=1658519 RepID=UPI003D2908F8